MQNWQFWWPCSRGVGGYSKKEWRSGAKMHLKDFPDVLTVMQLAQVLGIGKNTAYTLVQDGTIGHLKVGRKYLVPKRCVVDYLNSPRYNSTCNGGLNPTVTKGDNNDRKPAS